MPTSMLGIALAVVAAKTLEVVLVMVRGVVVLVMAVVNFKGNPLLKPVPVTVGRGAAMVVAGALNPRLKLPAKGVVVDKKLGVAEVAGIEELATDAKSDGALDIVEAAADAAILARAGATVPVGLTPSTKPVG